MKYVHHVTIALFYYVTVDYICQGHNNAASSEGYRLPDQLNYVALASKLVRPDQAYNIYVSIYRLQYNSFYVRASLSYKNEEYATSSVLFKQTGTKQIQLRVPHLSMERANHTLRLEGMISEGTGHPVFSNQTIVYYQPKYVSLFISTDQPLYYAGQTVLFRVVGISPKHQAMFGDMTIFLKDANGIVVRRWIQRQLNLGVYSDTFKIPYPVNIGNWSLTVQAFGEEYTHSFLVTFFYRRRFDVIIEAPLYILDSDWGIAGTLEGEHTSSAYVEGNATITAYLMNANESMHSGSITKHIPYMNGQEPFAFSMEELQSEFGDMAGHRIFLKAWIYHFFWQETINGTFTIDVHRDEIKVKALGKKFRPFKTDSAFEVNFAVVRGHGLKSDGFYQRHIMIETVYIAEGATRIEEERVIIPDDSIIRHVLTPNALDLKINVRAHHQDSGQAADVECYRYWSNQNKYMAITTSTGEATVNSYMVFTLRLNFHIEEVNALVMSDGAIVVGSTLIMNSMQKTFGIALSRDMAPSSRIVVYCVVDGEIITDSLTFYVKDTILMDAQITLNYGKDFRGDKIEIIGKAKHAGGYLSLNGYHKVFYDRGGNSFIDEDMVTKELFTYNVGDRNDIDEPLHHIWYDTDGKWEKNVYLNQPTTGIDFITTFNTSGLVVLSDMNLTVTEEESNCNSTLGLGRCLSGDCYDLKNACDGNVDCKADGYDEMGCPLTNKPEHREVRLNDLHLAYRYFPANDWTWNRSYIKHTGQVEVMLDVPDIDRMYVLNAFMLHPEFGISVIDEPLVIDTRRLFTMNVEAPFVIRKGEQVGVRCTLFNYWEQDLEIIAMLHGSKEYRFIVVEEFGIVSSYSPRTVSGDIQTMVSLPANSHRTIHFPVVPTKSKGEVTVYISAYSILRTDFEERTIEILYDGVLNDDQTPYLIDLVNSGSMIVPDFDIVMPENFKVPEQRELLYVPGSNTITMFVWGDVVSPGFYEDHKSTEIIAGVASESADGFLFDFAINLQTLRFLQGTNTLDPEKAAKALSYMQSIIPRQFAYMQDDGSFKMFRRSPEPCLWLTSLILRVFHDAQASEWVDELYIDIDTLNQIALWITGVFNEEEQRWEETSPTYYDRNMWPEAEDYENITHTWNIPVTAHVVITLSTSHRLTGMAKNRAESTSLLASDYLADKMYSVKDPFQMSMIAYALHCNNHKDKEAAYAILQTMRRTGNGGYYWAGDPIPDNPYKVVDTRTVLLGRGDIINQANAVIATSYALILHIAHNQLVQAESIMKWLHTQHNDVHQHSSTQDTLIALQAMTLYAFEETHREIFQMKITLTATKPTDPPWEHVVYLNSSNFAERFEFKLEEAYGEIRATAQGTGFAFLHLSAFHRVEHQEYVNNPDFDYPFVFELAERRFTGRNNSYVHMTFCIKANTTNETGMVFMLVEVPTGYIISRDTIERMYASRTPGLRRVQYREQTLILFFDYILETRTCVRTQMDRWLPVANMSINYLANMFEYTETGIQTNYLFEMYDLFHLHICQVCGSFQCPYCPFYNTATLRSSTGQIVALTITAMFFHILHQHVR